MDDETDVNHGIQLKPYTEPSETESNATPALEDAFALEGRFGMSPRETVYTPVQKKEWMPVLVGLMSVCIIIILPFTVLNHNKLKTQGELSTSRSYNFWSTVPLRFSHMYMSSCNSRNVVC